MSKDQNRTQAEKDALIRLRARRHDPLNDEKPPKRLLRTFADPKVVANLPGSAVLDISYFPRREAMQRYVELFGGRYYVIDPFMDPDEKQAQVWEEWYHSSWPRILLCSNVLNMYPDNAQVVREMDRLIALAREDVKIAVTVHEGDRSGICKETAVNKWQRNQPIADYARYMRQHVELNRDNHIILIGF